MKTTFKLLIIALIGVVAGCIDDSELEPPQMTISYDPTEYITFSWRNPATIHVNIKSDEDIERFTMTSKPSYWTIDSVFPPYTHVADFDINNLTLAKGFNVEDSTVQLTFKAYSNGLCNEQFRKMKYQIEYPPIDSFEVEMCADPIKGNCLLSFDDKEAFKYTEYRTRTFDLVLVKETRSLWRNFGLGLASPDAIEYLYNYFLEYVPAEIDYDYDADKSNLPLRKTITYKDAHPRTDADIITPQLVDSNERWPECYLGDDEGLGKGVSNLELQTLYKVKLQNGKQAVLKITEIKNYDSTYPTIVMTVYYQK
ncbi:MAG: hypothetical protein J6Y24_09205 [Bacteroidales bacterium]|nr:hypothetical protein [Bacteroidales bacterium]